MASAEPDQQQHNPEALQDVEMNTTTTTQPAAPPPAAAAAPAAAAPVAHKQGPLGKASEEMDFAHISGMTAFFAAVVMIQSAVICGDGGCTNGYATVGNSGLVGIPAATVSYQVACGTVSLFFALIAAGMASKGTLSESATMGFGVFQFLWWVAGVIVLTFFGTYQTTIKANGYFASWGAFFFATIGMMSVSPIFKNTVEGLGANARPGISFLFLMSSVVMGASIAPCSPSSVCTNYNAFAVALSTISMAISLIMLFGSDKIPAKNLKFMAYFMLLWWTVGTGVVTFGNPFQSTGNGYFASYGALFASVTVVRSINADA